MEVVIGPFDVGNGEDCGIDIPPVVGTGDGGGDWPFDVGNVWGLRHWYSTCSRHWRMEVVSWPFDVGTGDEFDVSFCACTTMNVIVIFNT